MNAPAPLSDWTDANQRLLVAEFALIKALLGGGDLAAARERIALCRAALAAPAAIDRVVERLGLSAFERDLLLLAAGVEMDAELAALCAAAKAGARRPWATFGLALAVLADGHWSALTPARPLRRWRLVELADDAGLVAARLRIDERVLHCLAGIDYLDARLQPLLRRVADPEAMAEPGTPPPRRPLPPRWSRPARRCRCCSSGATTRMASATSPRAPWGAAACSSSRSPARTSPPSPQEVEALAALWEREAALLRQRAPRRVRRQHAVAGRAALPGAGRRR